MKIDLRITEKFAALIEIGNSVLATRDYNSGVISFVDGGMAEEWFVSAASFISRTIGDNSEHYRTIKRHHGTLSRSDTFCKALAVLKSAETDYRDGYLLNVKAAITAEVFDDFLEQAEHFIETDYFAVAVVIAGCVLEDGLRKLCARHGIVVPDKPKLDSMNAELAKAGVYEKLTFKKVTWLADLRNKAAHGKWDAFEQKDAVEMVSAVRRFMENHFT